VVGDESEDAVARLFDAPLCETQECYVVLRKPLCLGWFLEFRTLLASSTGDPRKKRLAPWLGASAAAEGN
jgi:hypothetical protein